MKYVCFKVFNLFSNSIEAIKEAGTIRISAWKSSHIQFGTKEICRRVFEIHSLAPADGLSY